MYKTLPKNIRSLPLTVDGRVFSKEWLKCIDEPESDLTKLIDMMKPVFIHWENKLLLLDLSDDINYLTLCKLISIDLEEALSHINTWIEWAQNTSSIREELEYIFIQRMRKFKYKPALARPAMIEYIVARDFKLGIHHHMRSINRLVNRDALFSAEGLENNDIIDEVDFPDFFLLDTIKQNNWDSYLFHLIKNGYTSTERSQIVKIHRRNLFKEEQQIWHLLKQKL